MHDATTFDPMAIEHPGLDLRGLAERAGLTAPDWTYDTALPLAWCDDVLKHTDHWPGGFGIVWAYPPRSIFGEPFALTREGAVLLAWYDQARKR